MKKRYEHILDIKPLPRRPRYEEGESFAGYLCKLGEANGYPDYNRLLLRATVRDGRSAAAPIDLDALSKLTLQDVKRLAAGAYTRGEKHHNRAGFLMGNPVNLLELNLNRPVICPICVSEKGIAEAHFDLRFMCGCPDHGVALLQQCPHCSNPLTWRRPKLLECNCGFDLRQIELAPMPDSQRTLLGLIRDNVLGDAPSENLEAFGFPTELNTLSLQSLLTLMWRIAGEALEIENPRLSNQIHLCLAAAAYILSNWPQNFYRMLDKILEKNNLDEGVSRSTGPLKRVYRDCFKANGKMREGMEFVRNALGQYAEQRPEYCGLGRRKWEGPRNLDNARFITTVELARRMGVSQAYVKKQVDSGQIVLHPIKVGGSVLSRVDVTASDMLTLPKGRIYSYRKAIQLLGMPQAVLSNLQRTGHFDIRHPVRPLSTGYHVSDLEAFKTKILSVVSLNADQPVEEGAYVSLGELMGDDRGSALIKAKIVRKMLEGEIPAYGTAGNPLSRILLSKTHCQKFTYFWTSSHGPTSSTSETARALECDFRMVGGLVKQGLLEGYYDSAALRISCASINGFLARYSFLSWLGKKFGLSVLAAAHLCKRNEIEVRYVELGDENRSPFIHNVNRKKLIEAVKRRLLAEKALKNLETCNVLG
jgi:hypothetical protein